MSIFNLYISQTNLVFGIALSSLFVMIFISFWLDKKYDLGKNKTIVYLVEREREDQIGFAFGLIFIWAFIMIGITACLCHPLFSYQFWNYIASRWLVLSAFSLFGFPIYFVALHSYYSVGKYLDHFDEEQSRAQLFINLGVILVRAMPLLTLVTSIIGLFICSICLRCGIISYPTN